MHQLHDFSICMEVLHFSAFHYGRVLHVTSLYVLRNLQYHDFTHSLSGQLANLLCQFLHFLLREPLWLL